MLATEIRHDVIADMLAKQSTGTQYNTGDNRYYYIARRQARHLVVGSKFFIFFVFCQSIIIIPLVNIPKPFFGPDDSGIPFSTTAAGNIVTIPIDTRGI